MTVRDPAAKALMRRRSHTVAAQSWRGRIACRHFVVGAVLVGCALLFTWPLGRHLGDRIPSGTDPATVALFGLFTAEWTAAAMEQGLPYWDAPFFYPHRGTFAWSEPQPFTSGLVWGLSKLVGIIAAYNIVLLAYLAGAGLATFALARQLTGDSVAALWAALWMACGAYSIQQLGVLHLLATAFPIACLALVLTATDKGRCWTVWGAGVAYFLTWMTCAQFGLFLSLLLPIVLVLMLTWDKRRLGRLARLGAALGVGLVLALPFLLAQRARLAQMGFERDLLNVTGTLEPLDLISPAQGHWLVTGILGWGDDPHYYSWDLGVTPLLCIAIACLVGRRRFWAVDPLQRRRRVALAGVALVSVLLGFGPRIGFTVNETNIGPYALLHAVVPGFDGIRSPARLGMFAMVAVAALSAPALATLRATIRRPRLRYALTVSAFTLLIAEMWAAPITLADPSEGIDDHSDVIAWLRAHPDGAVLELPMSQGDSTAELEVEVQAMRRALRHGHPIVNGYSGYFPEPFRQICWAVGEDLAGRGRRYMDALGVRYVLVHNHDYGEVRHFAIQGALSGQVVFLSETDTVYELRRPRLDPEQFAIPNSATLATAPGVGNIIRIPVTSSAHLARLFLPNVGRVIGTTWPGEGGATVTARLKLRGSVILDARDRWVHIQLLHLSKRSGAGEAALISGERVGDLLLRTRP